MSNDAQRERFEKAFPHLNRRPDPYNEHLYGAYETRLAYAVWCAAEAQYKELVKQANAVIERWNTPYWKETGPTAEFINAMRNELDKLEGKS
jgi:hypothetical protein